MHQLLESVETENYRGTSYPPYLREPPRHPQPDVHGPGLRGFERLDHSHDDLQAAMDDRELQAALRASLVPGSVPVTANRPFFDAFQPQSDSELESPLPLPIPPPLFPYSRSPALRTSATTSTTRSTLPSRTRRSTPGSGSNSGSRSRTRRGELASTDFPEPDIDPDLDPVAASVARNRAVMERMRREQEMAFRDRYEGIDMEEVSRRSREAQEEDVLFQRAIEESEKLAKEVEQRKRQDDSDHQSRSGTSSPASPPQTSSTLMDGHRVYDDEDEELQAALKASLQDVRPGYRPPPSPPHFRRRIPDGLSLSRKQTLAPVMEPRDLPFVFTPSLDSGVGTPRSIGPGTSVFPKTVVEDPRGEKREKHRKEYKGKGKGTQKVGYETDSEVEYEMEGSTAEPEDEEEVSVEEMRRRRLARFGA